MTMSSVVVHCLSKDENGPRNNISQLWHFNTNTGTQASSEHGRGRMERRKERKGTQRGYDRYLVAPSSSLSSFHYLLISMMEERESEREKMKESDPR